MLVIMVRMNRNGNLFLVMASPMKLVIWGLVMLSLTPPLYAQVSFAPAVNYTVGMWPDSVVAQDVNGDGKVDLVYRNSGPFTLSILTNGGNGDFALAPAPSVDGGVDWVGAPDVRGCGKVDLICASYYELDTISVLTNQGNGGFALSSKLELPYADYDFMAADMDRDGRADLICASNRRTLAVLTNNGSGGFSGDALYATGTWPWSGPVAVMAADVNGDGEVDLICANGYANTLSVLTNNGRGGLILADTLAVGASPYTAAVADINGEGKVALISANSGDDTLSVLTNNGIGGFVTAGTYSVGRYPYSVVAADLNGDGKLDLVCANALSKSLSVLTNNGSGGFGLALTVDLSDTGADWVTAADVNGDGEMDLIAADLLGNRIGVLINTSVFPPPASIPGLTLLKGRWRSLVKSQGGFNNPRNRSRLPGPSSGLGAR